MIHAYDRDYLYYAQNNLGHMLDFAVNTCEYDIDEFICMFLVSSVCKQFENGNPKYLVGKTGCELVRSVVYEIKEAEIQYEDVMYIDRSPEFWLGWVLAYYVWYRNCKFSKILNVMAASEMLGMYGAMHEADISKFVYNMDLNLAEAYTNSALARNRKLCGISQIELSNRTGVNLRIIQSYEQRLRDINKAQASTVIRLAKALSCEPEDLMESTIESES